MPLYLIRKIYSIGTAEVEAENEHQALVKVGWENEENCFVTEQRPKKKFIPSGKFQRSNQMTNPKVRIIGRHNAMGQDLYDLYFPWFHDYFPNKNNITGEAWSIDWEDGLIHVKFTGTGHSNKFREDQIELIKEG